MEELARLLAREKLLLERLLFRLVELRALLAAGEARFLPWAASEVDRATARLRAAELHRALVINELAGDAGVDDSALNLGALAETSPQPYAAVFTQLHLAFRALNEEISTCLATCAALAGDGRSLVTEVLDRVVLETDASLHSAPLVVTS